jgi:hypothetical protein
VRQLEDYITRNLNLIDRWDDPAAYNLGGHFDEGQYEVILNERD